ncbi:MAG: DNA-processing protein DprA [Planctomycetes bacterium]|nr:DNA-processing protein DprA [Planctomycetota bacterium]
MSEVISEIGRVHLRWALSDGVGPITFGRILIQLGDAEQAWSASPGELARVKGIGSAGADKIVSGRDIVVQAADEEIAAAAEHGVRILCRADEDYPPGLLRIPDPPIVLYVKGELRPTDAIAVAVVGSRRCTIYGSEQARRFGELLAGAGFTVVSGLARGIDAFAHHGAVDSGGRSLAVFGRGLTDVYPPENRALAEKILENGAWLAELPMRAAVRAANFPGRNRIIAGMTLGTVVVEAAQRSGALITARLACEYNREVFAIPGRAQDVMSLGTNRLIRDGAAKLTTDLDDILEELGEVGYTMKLRQRQEDGEEPTARPHAGAHDDTAATPTPGADNPADHAGSAPRPGLRLSKTETRVYEVVGYEPMLHDAILSAAELPPGEVLAAFTALELKGLIKRLPGNLVVRAGKA